MNELSTSESREKLAQSYSALIQKGYFNEQFGGNEHYIGRLMTKLVPQSTKTLLEIGGATGLWAEQLVMARPSLSVVTAVEISDGAQDYHKRLEHALKNRPNSQLKVIQADFLEVVEELPRAEIVTSSFSAQYMSDPFDYIQSLYDLTLPGGRVIFADTLTHNRVGNSISISAAIQSLLFVIFTYLQHGMTPPIMGLVRSGKLYGMYEEEAFKALAAYHNRYKFPVEAWKAQAQKYPDAQFHNLGIAGILVIPKPSN